MYPWLFRDVFGYLLPVYDILIIIGVLLMLFYVANRLEKRDGYNRKQSNKILLFIVISLVSAFVFSYLIDGVFHSIKEGTLEFGSANFLSGLIGGFASFWLLMKYFYKDENKDMRKISNTLITGVVLAHAFGRIGCFFAGCCYGIPTESFLGVDFAHGHAHTVYPGESVLPTQLFEAFFLFVLFFGMNKIAAFKNKEVETYVIGYGIWRIGLEFLRGDERGALFSNPLFTTSYNVFPTPAQLISLVMIIIGVTLLVVAKKKKLEVI